MAPRVPPARPTPDARRQLVVPAASVVALWELDKANALASTLAMAHPLSRALCKPKDGQRFSIDGVDYVLRGKLGDGAAGLVRKVERKSDGQPFAIKFIAPDPKYIDEASFDDVRARFKRESERGSKLDFHSLLKIHAHSDNLDGSAFASGSPKNPFLIMERSTGGTLEDFIRRIHPSLHGLLIIDEARLRIAIDLAEALEYLHERKLVHRDVKPGNIFLSKAPDDDQPTRAKLGDFGVVKWGDFHAAVTTGNLTATMQKGLGTMKYMPLEQALRPKEVDAKADVFSFGVTLFELFTGQILLTSAHVVQLMMANKGGGTTFSKWLNLGVHLPSGEDETICSTILDMVSMAVTHRPSIRSVRGKLQFEYEKRVERG